MAWLALPIIITLRCLKARRRMAGLILVYSIAFRQFVKNRVFSPWPILSPFNNTGQKVQNVGYLRSANYCSESTMSQQVNGQINTMTNKNTHRPDWKWDSSTVEWKSRTPALCIALIQGILVSLLRYSWTINFKWKWQTFRGGKNLLMFTNMLSMRILI